MEAMTYVQPRGYIHQHFNQLGSNARSKRTIQARIMITSKIMSRLMSKMKERLLEATRPPVKKITIKGVQQNVWQHRAATEFK